MAERKKAGAKKAAPGRDGSGEAVKNEFLPPRPISLRTLGDYLDLSPATISLVLNNAPGVRSIPQETRDRVIAAAKKFEYRPSFFAREPGGLIGKAYAVYFRRILPAIGRVICGKDGPYNYLPASVGNFPPPQAMLQLMQATGYESCAWQPYTFGIAGLYTASRLLVV